MAGKWNGKSRTMFCLCCNNSQLPKTVYKSTANENKKPIKIVSPKKITKYPLSEHLDLAQGPIKQKAHRRKHKHKNTK